MEQKFSNNSQAIKNFFVAVKSANLEAILKAIENNKALLNVREPSTEFTALHYAIMQNRLDILKALIDAGASLNIDLNYLNKIYTIREFIELHATENKDAMLSTLQPARSTIMHISSTEIAPENEEKTVVLMSQIQREEDLFLQNNKKLVFKLAEAGEKSFKKLIALLDDHPDFLLLKNEEGNALQHVAVLGNNLPLLKYLIVKQADINIKNNNFGTTPLHFAVVNSNLEVVKLLLESGAKLNIEDNNHHTPLQLPTSQKISTLLAMQAVKKDKSKTISKLLQPSFQPIVQTMTSTSGFSSAKLKLIQRRTGIKLKAADAEIKALLRIMKLLSEFDDRQINNFELLKGISQNIRSLPEGNLKDRHAEIKWKYLIQLSYSLLKLKNSKELMCNLIIKHDLPNLRSLCEILIDEVKIQHQELNTTHEIITHQINSVLPDLISMHQSLEHQIDTVHGLLSIIESTEALKNGKEDKSLLLQKKTQDLQIFCEKNNNIPFIVEFTKEIFDKNKEEILNQISLAKEQIETNLSKLEAESVSVNYRINIITNNDDIQKADTKILQELHGKIKNLIKSAASSNADAAKISTEIITLKAHLLRLSGIGEGSVRDLSTVEMNKIIEEIEDISGDDIKPNSQKLKVLDTSIDKLIRSLGKNPYEDDMNAIHNILEKLVSLNANLIVGLKYKPDDKQLVSSLSGELKHLQRHLNAIVNNGKEGKLGLIKKFPEAEGLLEELAELLNVKDSQELQKKVESLIHKTCKLIAITNSNNLSTVDIALFDITKELANILRKNCISNTDAIILHGMLTELKQYATELPGESDLIIKTKQFVNDLELSENIDIATTLRRIVEILPPLESLKKDKQKEKAPQSEAISKFVNKLSEIQKHLLSNEAHHYGIQSLLNLYSFKNKQVWKDPEIIEKFQSLLKTSPSQLSLFLQWVKSFHETTIAIQEYKTLQNTRAKKREIIPLTVINTFIGCEYDRANLDVVVKYLTILLKHDPKLRAARAGMLATLLIMGEAFKDLSATMKKEGIFKNWYSFYAMRNAIHSILGEEGRKKFQQLLEAKDPAVEQLFIKCFEDIGGLKDHLIEMREMIPASTELIKAVEISISSSPEEIKKELADIIKLPQGLNILHQYLTQPNLSIQIDKSEQLSLLEVERKEIKEEKVKDTQESLVNDTLNKALAAQSLDTLILSIEAEAKFLKTYCNEFLKAPEIYSLACEFSVAYCGDIVRKLLDIQEYCDHLNEYFLKMHYQIKSERGDLMHDRVLKSDKFDQQDARYLWVVNELSPCTIIALDSMKLSIIGQEVTSKAESEFVNLNQFFNKKLSAPFNRIKLFLENALGKGVLDDHREHPENFDASLTTNKLLELEETKRLDLLLAIKYLLSDASEQIITEFKYLEKKWERDIQLRFQYIDGISQQIQQLQEYAKTNDTPSLEVFAAEVIKEEIEMLKIQLQERQRSLQQIIATHTESTLTKNLEKLDYFPVKLLQELQTTVKLTIKLEEGMQLNETPSATNDTLNNDQFVLKK